MFIALTIYAIGFAVLGYSIRCIHQLIIDTINEKSTH